MGVAHRQAVVGEEVGDSVAALELVGLHHQPLEEWREPGGGCHRLRPHVEVLLLQPRQLAQAEGDLPARWRGQDEEEEEEESDASSPSPQPSSA